MAKQLLFDGLQGKRTETTPWMAYAGTHMGFLIGETVDNYFQDPDLLVKGVTYCAERYKADGVPLCADLQIEAMALGCGYKWGKTDTPQIISHPCENMQPKEAGLKIPTSADGRFPVIVEAGKKMKPILDDMDVALIGFIAGPCTLAEHLIGGTKFYKSFYKDRDRMEEIFQFVSEVILASTRIYMNEIGCDIIAWVDPTATQLSEKDFRAFVTPALQSSIAEVHAAGRTSSFWL